MACVCYDGYVGVPGEQKEVPPRPDQKLLGGGESHSRAWKISRYPGEENSVLSTIQKRRKKKKKAHRPRGVRGHKVEGQQYMTGEIIMHGLSEVHTTGVRQQLGYDPLDWEIMICIA